MARVKMLRRKKEVWRWEVSDHVITPQNTWTSKHWFSKFLSLASNKAWVPLIKLPHWVAELNLLILECWIFIFPIHFHRPLHYSMSIVQYFCFYANIPSPWKTRSLATPSTWTSFNLCRQAFCWSHLYGPISEALGSTTSRIFAQRFMRCWRSWRNCQRGRNTKGKITLQFWTFWRRVSLV